MRLPFYPRAMQPPAYINYIDSSVPVSSYYGANMQRLESIKQTYDPENYFNNPMSIPLAQTPEPAPAPGTPITPPSTSPSPGPSPEEPPAPAPAASSSLLVSPSPMLSTLLLALAVAVFADF